tara:strand:+ start:423 stop:2375 length:1953 start_codon:yes stop_codon:yes gene_type:complete
MKKNPILWEPAKDKIASSQVESFRKQVNMRFDIDLKNYNDLFNWSINNIGDFWKSIWGYMDPLHSSSYKQIINNENKMLDAKWFHGAKLNFAENLLRVRSNKIAIIATDELNDKKCISYNQLYNEVESLASSLRKWGIQPGDRIAGIMTNSSESIISMLAVTSIGAIWSSCSPDFGAKGILDRFKQIKPKVIFSISSYSYNGKKISLNNKLNQITKELNTLEKIIIINEHESKKNTLSKKITWENALDKNPKPLKFEQLPFDHPIYILYSSGTTGLPKSIVHGSGGTLLQHLKELRLHTEISDKSTVFYYTTCGWMMWNWLVSCLAIGSTIVLYDGSPFYPNSDTLWNMIDNYRITHFGISPKYLDASENQGSFPLQSHKLNSLEVILSTGSTLKGENFDYVYDKIKKDVRLSSISGGTDIVSCFVLGNPTLPVRRAEIQCIGLGMNVQSLNENKNPIKNSKGELVCTKPFPSMPISFWNDNNNIKYINSYFKKYPNIWHHGDFLTIYEHNGVQIFGRSDTTLNPGGVRIGTSEIYNAVEKFEEIIDSLAVSQSWKNDERIVLFIKLKKNKILNQKLIALIKESIKLNCSPKHVPKLIIQINDIPYTISGKKVELAVKKIINGDIAENKDVLSNPESLKLFEDIPELDYN